MVVYGQPGILFLNDRFFLFEVTLQGPPQDTGLISKNDGIHFKLLIYEFLIFINSYFYSTTKHEILQISIHNLLCSLDLPNQGWLF